MAGAASVNGYITRANLVPAQANLPILASPYWTLLGDEASAADQSSSSGIDAAISAHKYIWADSPYVAGQLPVLATPDNSTLALRILCNGPSLDVAQTQAAAVIQAITGQLSYIVSITLGAATWAWECYTGNYQVAFNQLYYFGSYLPLYVFLPRNPVPVSGPA